MNKKLKLWIIVSVISVVVILSLSVFAVSNGLSKDNIFKDKNVCKKDVSSKYLKSDSKNNNKDKFVVCEFTSSVDNRTWKVIRNKNI